MTSPAERSKFETWTRPPGRIDEPSHSVWPSYFPNLRDRPRSRTRPKVRRPEPRLFGSAPWASTLRGRFAQRVRVRRQLQGLLLRTPNRPRHKSPRPAFRRRSLLPCLRLHQRRRPPRRSARRYVRHPNLRCDRSCASPTRKQPGKHPKPERSSMMPTRDPDPEVVQASPPLLYPPPSEPRRSRGHGVPHVAFRLLVSCSPARSPRTSPEARRSRCWSVP